VHRARLNTGERVVVKVQHAGIDSKVNEDLEVLGGLAQLAEQFPEFTPYRPTANVAEMGRTLRRELDFGREERNLHQFAELFRDDPTITVPKAYTELSTPQVLTMEMVDGIPLSQPGLLEAAGLDREEVARRGANLYMQMIFTHGFFHADPHPGNILLLPGNVVGLLDFGMVGRIDERLRENIEDMLMAIVQHDVPLLVRIVKQIGKPPPQLDEAGLANDIADFVGIYSTQSLEHFPVGAALTDMMEIMRRYRIMLPANVAMLIKTLVTLEGTARLLSPRFSLMEVMQPFHRKMLLRRFSPTRQAKKLRRLYLEVEQLVEILPQRIIQILEQVQDGKFDVHLDHRGLGPSVNRLVLGMLASALFVGSSFLLSYQVPPLLFHKSEAWLGMKDISLLGLSGCVLSLLVGLRLLRAIGKSGHLDQKVSK
jgi:ubiquinone biosynthesis protein